MILPFFTKRIRQPSQSADVHSDRQIVPFGVRCANSILIGIAVAYVLARLDYFARGVAMLICGGAVYFDYLGKIDAPTKRDGDGGSVRGVAIRAELESASGGATHLLGLGGVHRRAAWRPLSIARTSVSRYRVR